jgi:hypothetical protein
MLEDIIFNLPCNKIRQINLQVQKEIIIIIIIIIIIKLRLPVPLLICLYISVPHPPQSQSTFFISTHLHPVLFLPVSCWLMAVLISFLQMFLQIWEIQSFRTHWQKCRIETPGTLGVPNRIFRNTGTELFTTHKTGTNGISMVESHRGGKMLLHFSCVALCW